MAIGVPLGLAGGQTGVSSTSFTLTTTADAPAGAAILVVFAFNVIISGLTVVDSAANTYTVLPLQAAASRRFGLAYCADPVDLPSGGTITLSWTTAAAVSAAAASVSGLATTSPLDVTGTATSGTATSATPVASGTLAQAAEILIGVDYFQNSPGTFSPGGSFAQIAGPSLGTGTD
ncbi:MAG: hypothetical protein ACREQ5_32465, partial [Candidatus Dormibacteria bacterium]